VLKKIARQAVSLARNWLDEDTGEKALFESPLYSWANPLYLEIIEDERCRSAYTWGVIQGVRRAKSIGLRRVSIIEFGVANGNGLVALENIAEKVESAFDVGVDVYGFDTGAGLPELEGYRDKPHLHLEGDFPMDQGRLQALLHKARLVLGPIKETLSTFIESRPHPVAFIAFDLDLYSSTTQALRLLEADQSVLMPRIDCFFDDAFACGDYDGERLAISEFNASQAMRKISVVHGLRYFVPARHSEKAFWGKYYMAYIFDHGLYGKNEGLLKRVIDLRHQ
jgi:hypothetical protein